MESPKKSLIFSQKKAVLLFQETETSKRKLKQKKTAKQNKANPKNKQKILL